MDGLQLASMAPPPAHCVCHLPRLGRGGWKYAPSPCGDMVLKSPWRQRKELRYEIVSVPLRGYGFEICVVYVVNALVDMQFPSPCGDMVLKWLKEGVGTDVQAMLFPSPYGDMVLK